MAYRGIVIPIQVGQAGLQTDVAQVQQPSGEPMYANPNSLLMAKNVTCRFGRIEKDRGSQKWNSSALPGGVVALADWWPTDTSQRVIAACRDGKLYRYTNQYSVSEITPEIGTPPRFSFTDQAQMVAAGAEQLNSPRKLFVFTGNDPVQVVTADGKTRRQISKPALDWRYVSGSKTNPTSYPIDGIVHGGGLWVWGNGNNPHAVYRSNVLDHEDFQTSNAIQIVTIFPGESDAIKCGFVWKGRLWFVKKPRGLYYIDLTNPAAPFPVKISSSFGAENARVAAQTLDDMLVGNSVGSISTLKAVFSLGEAEQGDYLKMLRCLNQVAGMSAVKHALYYEDKKQSLFVYRSPSSQKNDRILVIDEHDVAPKVTWIEKDQPSCLALIRDIRGIPRPFYGAEDGFIYCMDSPNRDVGGSAYEGMFQIPYLDFGWMDPKIADRDKVFEMLAVTFESQGNWDLKADIFCDDRFVQTVSFNMSRGKYLSGAFPLDATKLNGPVPINKQKNIEAFGKRISVRFYNAVAGQNFKVSEIQFGFRLAGNKNR